ncbi:MAG TPA: nucleoside monophosphate kinase, partial [Nitrospira sp.]|nr:nucleoside monophosphate kinase [Nitrospira sp.]
MKRAFFNLILLGDPASGKGTQAEHIVKKYRLYDLDMGREVRKPAAKRRYDYRGTTAIGKLTPTGVVRGIFKHVIATVPPSRGILFNGSPKMIGEAQLVARLLAKHKRRDPLVIYLSIPMKEVVRRTESRKIYVNGRL